MTVRQFLNGLLLLVVLLMISGTTGDPDLWGHVRFGQDMLAEGAVRVPDTYSFTTDRPWVNHEWLSEVAMAAAFELLGAAGLNLLRIAIVGAVLGLAWYALGRVNGRFKVLILSAGALGMFLRAHPIRPQLFSLLMFAVLLTVLFQSDVRKSLRPLIVVPLVMAIWVNCHGGWIVGVGMFGLWCLLTAVTLSWKQRAALAAVGLTSVAATLANPYGIGMWEFLATTVRVERPMIADWQPLYALPYDLWGSWIAALGLVALAAARSRYIGHEKALAIAALLGVLAIRVSRLDAFFAIAAMFFAARALGQGAVSAAAEGPAQRPRWALACAFAVCVAGTVFIGIPRVVTVPMAAAAVPDADVVEYVKERRLTGNVLTWFDWGQYTIWHFGGDLKVSMDGRRETVYSAELVDAHMRFYFGQADAWRYADTLQPDYVWLPKQLAVVGDLRRNGWYPLCEGATSILLTRRHHAAPCDARTASRSRLFPQL